MPKIFRPWEDNSVKVSPNNWPFKPEARLCATDCSPKITSEKTLLNNLEENFRNNSVLMEQNHLNQQLCDYYNFLCLQSLSVSNSTLFATSPNHPSYKKRVNFHQSLPFGLTAELISSNIDRFQRSNAHQNIILNNNNNNNSSSKNSINKVNRGKDSQILPNFRSRDSCNWEIKENRRGDILRTHEIAEDLCGSGGLMAREMSHNLHQRGEKGNAHEDKTSEHKY